MSLNKNEFKNLKKLDINSNDKLKKNNILNQIKNSIFVNTLASEKVFHKSKSYSVISNNRYKIKQKNIVRYNNSIPKIKHFVKKNEVEEVNLILVKNTSNYDMLQIDIINKLNDPLYKSEELIYDLFELIQNSPIINELTSTHLIKKEDFEILEKKKY